jgi:hypothetical protein
MGYYIVIVVEVVCRGLLLVDVYDVFNYFIVFLYFVS